MHTLQKSKSRKNSENESRVAFFSSLSHLFIPYPGNRPVSCFCTVMDTELQLHWVLAILIPDMFQSLVSGTE
jgi:hypothetical protein